MSYLAESFLLGLVIGFAIRHFVKIPSKASGNTQQKGN